MFIETNITVLRSRPAVYLVKVIPSGHDAFTGAMNAPVGRYSA